MMVATFVVLLFVSPAGLEMRYVPEPVPEVFCLALAQKLAEAWGATSRACFDQPPPGAIPLDTGQGT